MHRNLVSATAASVIDCTHAAVICRAFRDTMLRLRLSILRNVAQTFGERLRALRERRKLTVSQLAIAVRITEGAIRQMESGQTKSASFLTGLRLATTLDVTPWYLATGQSEGAAETAKPRRPGDAGLVEAIEALTKGLEGVDRRVRELEARAPRGRHRKSQG
jgi:transcriptional regulator with XRE-family HTH domain